MMQSQATQLAATMRAAGDDWDTVFCALRRSGHSKIDCIRAMHEVEGISMADAKRIVHFADAWSDVRERDDAFHDQMEKALPELARSRDVTATIHEK